MDPLHNKMVVGIALIFTMGVMVVEGVSTTTQPITTTTTKQLVGAADDGGDEDSSPISLVPVVIGVLAGLVLLAFAVLITMLKKKRRINEAALPNILLPVAQRRATSTEEEEINPLHIAVVKGDMATLHRLLHYGAVNEQDDIDMVPSPDAYMAAVSPPMGVGELEMQTMNGGSKDIVEKPYNVNEIDKNGNTLLAWCVRLDNLDALKLLLQAKADPNIPNFKNQTPLHTACLKLSSEEMVQALLDAGGRHDLVDSEGYTPIAYAACNGSVGLTQRLIDVGADVNCCDRRNMTPIMMALCRGHVGVASLLCRRRESRVNWKDKTGWTPLHWAVAVNSVDCVGMLLGSNRINVFVQNQAGETPLHIAAKEGNLNVIKLLLGDGNEPHVYSLMVAKSDSGQTAAEYARAANKMDCAAYIEGFKCKTKLKRDVRDIRSESEEDTDASSTSIRITRSPASTIHDDYSSDNSESSRPQFHFLNPGDSGVESVLSMLTKQPETANSKKRNATGAPKSGEKLTPEERKKRHREYMRDRRRQEREQIHIMESKVDELGRENQHLTQAVMQLRQEAAALRDLVGSGQPVSAANTPIPDDDDIDLDLSNSNELMIMSDQIMIDMVAMGERRNSIDDLTTVFNLLEEEATFDDVSV